MPFRTALASLLIALPCAVQAVAPVWPTPDQALQIALPPTPPPSASVEARDFTPDGIATSLARDLAKALNRELAPASSGAHLGLDRRAYVPGIATGYRSGLSVSMRTDTDIAAWEDIAGRRICYTQTNDAARRIIAHYRGIAVPERAPARSLMKVRTGECDAGLHEAALLAQLFQRPEWQKFSASLPPLDDAPLTLTLADPASRPLVQAALDQITAPDAWDARTARWARNVAFEVWLEQDAPDCH